jgi:ATP-dependent DNA helicase RecQ
MRDSVTQTPKSILKSVFGFDEFRPHQEPIIKEALSSRDVFAALPTGGGKSLCYQLPALLRPGLTVVVSPLIALMKDQVDAAKAAGIEAGCLNSSMDASERAEVFRALDSKQMKLLYIAPERLAVDGMYERLTAWGCSAVAVDEAHCISEWGHEFRPDYRQLSRLRSAFPGIPLMALTATATNRVQADIISQLGLENPLVVRAGFDRPEIFYRVEPKRDVLGRIADFVTARKGRSGIVYRGTRKDVEKTATYLSGRGIEALPYHAGLPEGIRRRNQDDFKTDRVQVIVATVAFGLGIDKPDIRFVVHGDLPKSLEAYYQETGRSGRDGDDSEVLLLWSAGDMATSMFHIGKLQDAGEKDRAGSALRKMLLYARTFACRRKVLLAHFDEEHPGTCGGCDVCAGEVESIEATEDARKLLSAAARTEQRYGSHYLVDIVRGTETEKIKDRGHDSLPTFGVGADASRKYWLGIADDLEAGGFVYRDEERFKALTITEEGKTLLFGKTDFRTVRRVGGRKESIHAGSLKFASNSTGGEEKELTGGDLVLFEQLRALRFEKAKEIGKPPYVIFPDKTLRALAVLRPHTGSEMLACPGVGEKKLATWGELFLSEIRGFESDGPGEQ